MSQLSRDASGKWRLQSAESEQGFDTREEAIRGTLHHLQSMEALPVWLQSIREALMGMGGQSADQVRTWLCERLEEAKQRGDVYRYQLLDAPDRVFTLHAQVGPTLSEVRSWNLVAGRPSDLLGLTRRG